MPSISFSRGRWENWRSHPDQRSTDALGNWANAARARVDWEMTDKRRPDNTIVHVATPYLTSVERQSISDYRGYTLEFPCANQAQVDYHRQHESQRWRETHPEYEFIEAWTQGRRDEFDRYMVSILGEGPNVQTAKAVAAGKLLASGHCMFYRPN